MMVGSGLSLGLASSGPAVTVTEGVAWLKESYLYTYHKTTPTMGAMP